MDKRINTNIWVEKYRPLKLNDVVYCNSFIKQVFEQYIINKNIPHLLLSGPSGVGKTSTIISIAKELFPGKLYDKHVTIMNASDERGIDIVRNKILTISSKYIFCDEKTPPFKLIILDEADAMTREAQFALKRLIELHSKTTRFCFICNYKHKIIRPIESRCTHIVFPQLNNEYGITRLKKIAKLENIKISTKHLAILLDQSSGDLRKAISMLQNLSYIYKTNSNKITINDINNICDIVPTPVISKIIATCKTSKSVNDLNELAKYLYYNSFSTSGIIDKLINEIRISTEFDDLKKAEIFIELMETYKIVKIGGDEYICVLNLLCVLNETMLK